jgi:hypothetical protein
VAVTLNDFEASLFEYLTGAGIEPIYSQAVPQDGETPCLVIRESGSTNVYDLEGPWEIVTANYELACLVASRDSAVPEVSLKIFTQTVMDAVHAIVPKQTIGTSKPVRMDSATIDAQTTRQFADGDNAGTVFLYELRCQFNWDSTEV